MFWLFMMTSGMRHQKIDNRDNKPHSNNIYLIGRKRNHTTCLLIL